MIPAKKTWDYWTQVPEVQDIFEKKEQDDKIMEQRGQNKGAPPGVRKKKSYSTPTRQQEDPYSIMPPPSGHHISVTQIGKN